MSLNEKAPDGVELIISTNNGEYLCLEQIQAFVEGSPNSGQISLKRLVLDLRGSRAKSHDGT